MEGSEHTRLEDLRYKALKLEDIEQAMAEYFASVEGKPIGKPIGLLSNEEAAKVRRMFGSMIETLGERLYHIGNGCITGDGGWELFNKAVEDLMKKETRFPDMPFFQDVPLNGYYGFDAKVITKDDNVYVVRDLGNNQYVFSTNFFCKGDLITDLTNDEIQKITDSSDPEKLLEAKLIDVNDVYSISHDCDILVFHDDIDNGWVYSLDRPLKRLDRPFRKVASTTK